MSEAKAAHEFANKKNKIMQTLHKHQKYEVGSCHPSTNNHLKVASHTHNTFIFFSLK